MYLRRTTLTVAAAIFLALMAGAFVLLLKPGGMFSSRSQEGLLRLAFSSERAFHESYLDAVEGKDTTHRTQCKSCHENASEFSPSKWTWLNRRSELGRQAWAEAVSLQAKCGVCHLVPDPSTLPRQSWGETLSRMQRIMESRQIPKLPEDEWQDILHFYLSFCLERWPLLAADPDPAESPVQFQAGALGNPKNANPRERPVLGHVQIEDLDRDGLPDVLVCDIDNSLLTWVHLQQGTWREEPLAKLPYPAHTQVAGTNRHGNLNIVVACLGSPVPTEDPVGSVVLLVNDGAMHFRTETILRGVGRVADVEPGDFDGDGDVDFVVGAYGYVNNGEIGWLENISANKYSYHVIVKRTGAIHVLPADVNGDGRLDFVALFGQEHEQISAFINDGKGGFQEQVLFKAATPSFGSSGMQLVDFDGDGDLDILYTNGDNMDLPTMISHPYHGVQWLENQGNLKFVWHDIHRFYGAYCAVAADLNNDGKLDIVATSMFNDWSDPKRASLLWLENDGRQHFTPHTIAREPIHLISAAVADLDGDGWADIVACGMNAFPPFNRIGRITLWKNRHTER